MFNPVMLILNTKIRNKLIAMCICVIVPVLAAGVYLTFGLSTIVRDSVINESYAETANLAARLSDILYTATTIAERIYEDNDFNELFEDNFSSATEYSEYYREHAGIIRQYTNILSQISDVTFYIDIEGFMYNRYFRKASQSIKDTPWYKDAISSESERWHVVFNESNRNRHLSYVRAVYNSRGESVGVIVIAINPGWLETIMKDETSDIIFTVGSGTVFYSNMEAFTAGRELAVTSDLFKPGMSDTFNVSAEEYSLARRGFTIVSFFDYENSGNLFQVFLVRDYSLITGYIGRVMITFFWYMLLCVVLSILLTLLFSSFFSRRIQFLKNEMHIVAQGNFELENEIVGTDEIFDLYSDLKRMVSSMQHLINEAYEAKINAEVFKANQIEAEFKTLASQINPHFLYNTLETIRMKSYTGGDKETADLVKRLGKFMRRCLEVKDSMVALESELEFTNGYLEIQKARFGERVKYSLYCEVDKNYKILPLIIQPIVENAFVHGVEGVKSGGHISIRVYYKQDSVLIDVIDNGCGMSAEKLSALQAKLTENDTSSGRSIGLTNVNKRVKMYHGEDCGLTVSSAAGKGTTVRLVLPREVTEYISAVDSVQFI
ncbi:MAG: sensor histidine kinase [Oscillospiraceae bacterium]|nr:sensor histidine kinase [Oscillospiraceae bacterium]